MATTPEATLLEALLEDRAALAEQIVERTRAEIASFASVPRAEHLAETLASIEWLARDAILRPGSTPDLEQLALLGARRAEQGVPVEDMLRAWRLSVRIGTDRARALATQLGLSPETVIDIFQNALRAADAAFEPLAGGHRQATHADPEGDGRERFVIAALHGELEAERLRAQAAALGLDLTRSYRAVRAVAPAAASHSASTVGLWAEGGSSPEGLSARRDGEIVGFTAGEVRRGAAELVALGPAVAIGELSSSYSAAGRILNATRSFGLAGVHEMASAALFVAVFESGDAGDALVARYVEPLAAAANGPDLLATVRIWQEAGMRAEAAAERLHVHPNTLRYRLARFEQLTGADLSETEELVAIWIALNRHRASLGG